jgi:redox-sensitive bicupin YhaK (pirin superfamily)
MRTDTSVTKELVGVYQAGSHHMVGDGFPVRNMIPGAGVEEQLSPFLMLDYMGPQQFPPTDAAARGRRASPSRL